MRASRVLQTGIEVADLAASAPCGGLPSRIVDSVSQLRRADPDQISLHSSRIWPADVMCIDKDIRPTEEPTSKTTDRGVASWFSPFKRWALAAQNRFAATFGANRGIVAHDSNVAAGGAPQVQPVWIRVTDSVSISTGTATDGTPISLVIEALASGAFEWMAQNTGAPHMTRAGVAPSMAEAMAAAIAAAADLA